MRKFKKIAVVAALSMVATLFPAGKALADISTPVDKLNAPVEVLVGNQNPSDQTPSKLEVKAIFDDETSKLFSGICDGSFQSAEELEECEMYAQFDFSLDGGESWLSYDEKWDTLQKVGSYYEHHANNITLEENTNKAFSTCNLFDWMENDGAWSNDDEGYKKIIDKKYVIDHKYNEYQIPYINYNEYTVVVRSRSIMYYRYKHSDQNRYIYSDWTKSKPFGNFKADDKKGNLLINGDFEDGMKGWSDPDKCWDSVMSADCHEGRHGLCLCWPVYANNDGYKKVEDGKSTYIYQDVSLANYKAGQTAVFNCQICNYDQGDGDMGTASLIFIDKNGKTINSSDFTYRNPNWISRTIVASIPNGAVKARVKLAATLYAGSDVDVYWDYASLVITNDAVHPVMVTEKHNKWQAKSGDVLQLTANNGISTNPLDYDWYSSYESNATVDASGKVTMKADASQGVIIYATDKKTGVAGLYMINIEDPERVFVSYVGQTFATKNGAKVKVLTDGSKGNTAEYTPATKNGKVTVPDTVTVDGVKYKVTAIKNGAFKKSKVTEVKLGKNITKIDKNAFSGCTKLKKITIGAGVKTIGDKAFYGCKALKSVTIPAKVTKIGKSAFEKCTALKKVTIKSKKITLGAKCFKSISKTATVTAPKKLKNAAKIIKKAGVKGKKQKIKVK